MKAVCVTDNRTLAVREVMTPTEAPEGHVLVQIEACGINHGDKAFLAMPRLTAGLISSLYDIWGASAAGTVLATGAGVPEEMKGRRVAVYRSLTPSGQTVGLWSERAVVPWTSCVVVPNEVAAAAVSGSLVNAITAYAFLDEITTEGHTAVIVTAGSSATGLAMAAVARRRGVPLILLVRSERSREELSARGIEHVLVTSGEGFAEELAGLAERMRATAIFDGVGGELTGRLVPQLPVNSTVWFYGFLAGPVPVCVSPGTFMAKNLTMKRFSNFNSATVRDPERLRLALSALGEVMADPLLRTRVGKTFPFAEIDAAMAFESTPGAKAVLVP